MKKTFTKLAGGIMAASMILGTAGVAAPQVFADDTTPAATLITQDVERKITITKNTEDAKAHTYKAYEIFDGVYDTVGGVLKQIEWGANIDTTKLDAAEIAAAIGCTEDAIKDKDGNLKAELVADALGLIKTEIGTDGQSAVTKDGKDENGAVKVGDAAKALAFAELMKSYIKGDAKESSEVNGKYEITVNTGYWLILDETAGAVSDTILKLAVEENSEIKPKSSVPQSEKHVLDVNDTDGTTSNGWKDSADYDIGDTVPYELVASLGDGVQNYKDYWMNFVDTISEGLTFNKDTVRVVVDYDGDTSTTLDMVQLSDGYTVSDGTAAKINSNGTPAKELNATKYEIEIDDLFSCTGVDKDQITGKTTVTVYYNATLNDNCQFNEIGNPNEFKLEYNRNPQNDKKGKPADEDKGETTTDRNIVFTYTLDVDKVDSSNQPLDGAKFRLYKKIDGNATLDTTAKTVTYKVGEKWTETKDAEGNVTARTVEDVTKTVPVELGSELKKALSDEVKTKTTLDDNTWYVDISKGEVAGTKDASGKYCFDFDGLDDGKYVLIESTVPAGYNPTDAVEFTITASHELTSDAPQLLDLTSGNNIVSASTADGLATTVVNKKGTELPSTGGIGTTVFYIVGAAAAVTAIVLLTTRRRANKED